MAHKFQPQSYVKAQVDEKFQVVDTMNLCSVCHRRAAAAMVDQKGW